MKGFNWAYDFDPQFPVTLFPYHIVGNQDKMHWHRYYEIGLCTGGSGRFVYFNKEYAAKPGDIFISNNYESHVAVGGEESDYVFLIFLPSFIAVRDGRWVDRQYVATFNYNPLTFVNRIPGDSASAQKIASLIREGFAVYEQKERGYQMRVDVVVRQVLMECALYYARHEREGDGGVHGLSPKIRAAQEYISNNYSRSLTLAEVAGQVGLNASYLRHLFKAETQLTFKEYVTYLRLSQARTLLLGSDRSINRIIEEVGYSNISQFYRVFKQHYNMTPAQYREVKHDVAR